MRPRRKFVTWRTIAPIVIAVPVLLVGAWVWDHLAGPDSLPATQVEAALKGNTIHGGWGVDGTSYHQYFAPDGTTLLDNTLLTYGSGLGDGATHQYNDLPIVVAGGKALGFKSGQHLHCADGTPLANLWLTQARAMGIERKRFADSSGTLDSLLG